MHQPLGDTDCAECQTQAVSVDRGDAKPLDLWGIRSLFIWDACKVHHLPSNSRCIDLDAIETLTAALRPSSASLTQWSLPAWSGENVGPFEPLRTLSEEFRYNHNFGEKVRLMEGHGAKGWRRVRGDGNCFWRSVAFSWLEQLSCLHPSDSRRRTWAVAMFVQMIDALSTDSEIADAAFIRALRQLVANFITAHADDSSMPGGISYNAVCRAQGWKDAAHFAMEEVMTMGCEAEGITLPATAMALGIDLCIIFLDRQKASNLTFVDYPARGTTEVEAEPVKRLTIHLQHRPGHYDLIYFTCNLAPLERRQPHLIDSCCDSAWDVSEHEQRHSPVPLLLGLDDEKPWGLETDRPAEIDGSDNIVDYSACSAWAQVPLDCSTAVRIGRMPPVETLGHRQSSLSHPPVYFAL